MSAYASLAKLPYSSFPRPQSPKNQEKNTTGRRPPSGKLPPKAVAEILARASLSTDLYLGPKQALPEGVPANAIWNSDFGYLESYLIPASPIAAVEYSVGNFRLGSSDNLNRGHSVGVRAGVDVFKALRLGFHHKRDYFRQPLTKNPDEDTYQTRGPQQIISNSAMIGLAAAIYPALLDVTVDMSFGTSKIQGESVAFREEFVGAETKKVEFPAIAQGLFHFGIAPQLCTLMSGVCLGYQFSRYQARPNRTETTPDLQQKIVDRKVLAKGHQFNLMLDLGAIARYFIWRSGVGG